MNFGSFEPLMKRYQRLRLLSRSGTTEVYQAYDVTMLHFCVVKIHQLGLEPSSKVARLEAIRDQCEAFRALKQGVGFAALLDHFELESGAKYVMVWEYCENFESFESFCLRNVQVSEKEARGILLQLLGALRAAEKGGFPLSCLDLKPSRINFRGGEVKIGSVGFPQLRSAMARRNSRSSLEVPGESVGQDSLEADDDDIDGASQAIRVAGVIFYELIFGKAPETRGSETASLELPDSPKISQECKDCLCRMRDRETRITVQEICSDAFFAPTKRR